MRSARLWISLLPAVAALLVWLSPLSFVPVPWPDDSAFYFVAKSLFAWPPRWVMLPQAPFEPTYREFNFNTMPLYPLLIGLGRLVGIDGSFLLKLWPLGAWAASGSLLVFVLLRRGLSPLWALALAAAFAFDPEMRWGAVIVRPESLIGLFGTAAILASLFGVPERLRERKLWGTVVWDPVAACLALAAYSHFNAIHLVAPVAVALLPDPRRLFRVGSLTLLYLSPWLVVVLSKLPLFLHQMELQWARLAVGNDWLQSTEKAVNSLFQGMGSPEGWSDEIRYASMALWLAIFGAACLIFAIPILRVARRQSFRSQDWPLLAGAAWVIAAAALWDRKPEVWFVYYIHLALWGFVGILLLHLSRLRVRWPLGSLGAATAAIALLFLQLDVRQALQLAEDRSWRWGSYHSFVDCVDERLKEIEAKKGRPLEVWCPTFPDITIELSRRHPGWDLTRTNDFHARVPLALEHGSKVDAVVVTEIWGDRERIFAGEASKHPEARSVWMTWKDYFLHQFMDKPGWMPVRHVCNVRRWQAYLFSR
ncbi:MAG TPA: hypothetical protein VM598_06525 [Bdellovibrionota bacterium]|nr:hypothetical protein [Bdellovibrionota bacterium]